MNEIGEAYQEAGREVIRHVLGTAGSGTTIESMTITDSATDLAVLRDPRGPFPFARLLLDLTVEWGGHLACARIGDLDDAELDATRAAVIKTIGTTAGQVCILRGHWDADRLLRQGRIWAAVTQVAEVLLAERALSPARVTEVVHRALRNGTVVAGRRGSRRCRRSTPRRV